MGRLSETMQPGVYAGGAGYKEPTTSRAAAAVVNKTLNDRQQEIMRAIRAAGDRGLTPDEAAEIVGRTVMAVRPRFTELGPKHLGLIEPTGERRPNESGVLAKAYRTRKDPA